MPPMLPALVDPVSRKFCSEPSFCPEVGWRIDRFSVRRG
jgi:hypothetical protein